jgi:type I restriction enzyme S subunit
MHALTEARGYLRSLASGSTHKTIYFPTVEQFSVLVPPITLQRQFAVPAAEVRDLQEVQKQNSGRLEDLLESLLQQAFGGTP